jgi:ubiquinone/menaquinone biosynthesis C-methylase UbiE
MKIKTLSKKWDKILLDYKDYKKEPHPELFKIGKFFKKKKIKKILDLGCGNGRNLIWLTKQDFKVYGFDISKVGIKITRDWLKRKGIKADLKIGSIYKKLPYKDNFFDAVISIQVIHHQKLKEIRKAIKEIERVLKPKGLIFLTVRKAPRKREQKLLFKEIEPRTYTLLEGKEKGIIHYFFNKELLRKEFKNFKIYNIWTHLINSLEFYALLGQLKK